MSDGEAWRVWRARRTAVQMCRDRGYSLTDAEVEQDFESFKAEFGGMPQNNRGSMTLLPHKINDANARIMVFFAPSPSVAVADLKNFHELMENQRCQAGVVVVQKNISPPARKFCDILATHPEKDKRVYMEVFMETELLINITEHELVPKHTKMSTDEKTALLKRYKLKDTQLPRLQTGDPIAKYYGLKRGDVVKIERPSETAGRYVTYRLVV